MSAPVIQFDYDLSPYGQKTRLLLKTAGVDFKRCEQPRTLPRPDLEALGITYRRIPLLAVGKDVYADSALMIDTIVSALAKPGAIKTSSADKAYETLGNNIFREVLGLMPVGKMPKEFIQDRKTIFPIIARPEFATMRPSTVASMQSRYKQIEDEIFTSSGPFPSGNELTLADIHFLWSVRWGLLSLGGAQEKGLGKNDLPKIYKAIESLPEITPEVLSSEETVKTIKESKHAPRGPTSVQQDDALGFQQGALVSVESTDSVPGAHTQLGKLVGTDAHQVVLEVGDDGVRLHYPRIGYLFRAQEQSKL